MVILSRGIKTLPGNIKISTNPKKFAEHEIMIGKQNIKIDQTVFDFFSI